MASSGSAKKPAWPNCSVNVSLSGTLGTWRVADPVPDRGSDKDLAGFVARRGHHHRGNGVPHLGASRIGDESAKVSPLSLLALGAMTVSHVNDEYFWLVTGSGGLSPLRGLALGTVGTLLQGSSRWQCLLVLLCGLRLLNKLYGSPPGK